MKNCMNSYAFDCACIHRCCNLSTDILKNWVAFLSISIWILSFCEAWKCFHIIAFGCSNTFFITLRFYSVWIAKHHTNNLHIVQLMHYQFRLSILAFPYYDWRSKHMELCSNISSIVYVHFNSILFYISFILC